ncbi:M48 family metalloprotease [Acidovorax lacteus]|uniref:M48 family metalloprotease n=1 Tax=Acidovorax lacteus TaxID=1924988 RepID=UPI0031E68D27
MEHADFVHLVRLSELASADNSRAYRRKVAAFAALGYAWVLGCAALAVALLAWALPPLLQGRFRFVWFGVALGGAALLWSSLRALWLRLEPPAGLEITAADAPELFEALERIRRKVKGPPLHRVVLDGEFNASIQQLPRWGLLGGSINHLSLGLPLVLALDRARLLAVLAHEYGHLRGDHGRFAAWIYRTRLAWMRLHDSMEGDAGLTAVATQAFFRWYFPRFAARSFAVARQDEYEADRIAGKLVGRDTVAAALAEIEVRGRWLDTVYWRDHWARAATEALPVGPYRAMRRALAQPPEPAFANDALRQAMKRLSQFDDTHPGLRDRLEALEAGPPLPTWSRGSAFVLLGEGARKFIERLDADWCRDHASGWKQQHLRLQRVRERVDVLAQRLPQASADECVELAQLQRQIDPRADVRALYEKALAASAEHPDALRGLAGTLPDEDRAGKLACLDRLWDAGSDHRWWAARAALAELETPRPGMEHDAATFKQWRKRLERAQESEERAWEELSGTPFFSQIGRHGLGPLALTLLQDDLQRCRPVTRAWLVRKQLREVPRRRAYLLFLELPDLDDAERFRLCRWIERQIDLPGPVLALWAGESPTLRDIERHAQEPVYRRGEPATAP